MKKILFIMTIFFLCVENIYAKSELIIKNIEINNGIITPKYDKYNNYYSVTIDGDIQSLEINTDYDKDIYDIKISNNENLKQNSLVYITIINKDNKEENTYVFKIYKEKTLSTINTNEEEKNKVETKKEKNYAPIVGTTCFILIILVYYFMFLK